MSEQDFDRDAALATIRRVAAAQGVRPATVTPAARVEEDLRMTGDDALEFIEAVAAALAIDMSDFVAADFIGPEAGVHPGFIGRWLGKPSTPLRPLTIARLIDAARLGRWVPDPR